MMISNSILRYTRQTFSTNPVIFQCTVENVTMKYLKMLCGKLEVLWSAAMKASTSEADFRWDQLLSTKPFQGNCFDCFAKIKPFRGYLIFRKSRPRSGLRVRILRSLELNIWEKERKTKLVRKGNVIRSTRIHHLQVRLLQWAMHCEIRPQHSLKCNLWILWYFSKWPSLPKEKIAKL